jgi:hypothetical protein
MDNLFYLIRVEENDEVDKTIRQEINSYLKLKQSESSEG